MATIGKLRGSWMLTRETWGILAAEKKLVAVTLLEALAGITLGAILLSAVWVSGIVSVDLSTEQVFFWNAPAYVGYLLLAVWYVISWFIFTFVQGMVAVMVRGQITEKPQTVRFAFAHMKRKIARVFAWALIASTVGVLLQMISERLSWLGSIVGFVGSVAWSLLTYFIVPVLALEDRPIKESLTHSGDLFRARWGETLGTNFSIGIITIFVFLGVIALMILSIAFSPEGLWMLLPVGIAVLVLGVVAAIAATLAAIARVALYEYASTGTIPNGFSQEVIEKTFTNKTPTTSQD